jgi:hypothetical protein
MSKQRRKKKFVEKKQASKMGINQQAKITHCRARKLQCPDVNLIFIFAS